MGDYYEFKIWLDTLSDDDKINILFDFWRGNVRK